MRREAGREGGRGRGQWLPPAPAFQKEPVLAARVTEVLIVALWVPHPKP